MAPFDRQLMSSCWHCTVSVVLSCIVSSKKHDIDRKARFSYYICIRVPILPQRLVGYVTYYTVFQIHVTTFSMIIELELPVYKFLAN